MKTKKLCLFGAASLAAGGMLYLLFREKVWLSRVAGEYISLYRLRQSFEFLESDFLKYYLPDYLWGFSLCCFLSVILLPFKKSTVISAALVFAAGLAYEILQLAGIIGGTFDLIDIGLYLLAGITVISQSI